MDFAAMCVGYLILTLCLLWVFANLYWHTHLVVCEIIAYIIMERPAKIKLYRLPIVFAKRWYEAWYDISGETTISWHNVGSWTTPRHIFSFGKYVMFEPMEQFEDEFNKKPSSASLKSVKDPTLDDN